MPLKSVTKPYVEEDESEMYQMWRCTWCRRVRQWGYGPSMKPKERPLLTCLCQVVDQRHVPHKYAGLQAPELVIALEENVKQTTVNAVFRSKA
jgi:hypothetical protein